MLNKLLAFFCSLTLVAGLTGTGTAAAGDFNGEWSGSWMSIFSTSGRIDTTIFQSGSTISGSLSIFSTDCGDLYNLPLSGSVSGSIASFSTSVSCGGSFNQLSFTQGMLSGNTITGNYVILADGVFYDSGSFILNRDCCTITATAGAGGSIVPSGDVTPAPGTSQTFNISADAGYEIADVTVDGVSQGAIPGYTFPNVDADHIIYATFTRQKSTSLPFLDIILNKK